MQPDPSERPRRPAQRHVRRRWTATTAVGLCLAGASLAGCGAQDGSSGLATSAGAGDTGFTGTGPPSSSSIPTAPPTTGTPTTDTPTTGTPTNGTSRPTTSATQQVVRPTLSFRDQSVLFRRPFALALRAKTSPPVTVRYRLVTDDARGDTNGWCHVNGNRLTLEEPPNLSLPVTCVVEASVPPASGLVPPRPVRAALQVNPPPLQISVPDRQVQWTAASGGVVSLRILEDTGNAYSMDVSSDNEDQCNVEGVSPAFPAPAGTTEFVAKVTVQNPDGASYQCGFTATAGPQDIFHDVEPYPFTVTIVP